MYLSLDEIKEIVPDPKWIVTELDKYIVGQHAAKKTLSLVAFNRYLLLLQAAGKIYTPTPLTKSNAMLIGPSGTGKTALVQALSEILGLPILIFDVSCLTASGYVGKSVDEIILDYVDLMSAQNASFFYGDAIDEDVAYKNEIKQNLMDYGMIYLDEIDKIKISHDSGLDITGDSIQNELLKVLEGNSPIKASNGWGSTKKDATVSTRNISFIVGGAFSGLDKIISKRLDSTETIGFSAEYRNRAEYNKEKLFSEVTTEDLILYGFKPEFLGRIPLRAVLAGLTVEIMSKIIQEPKNSVLKQYTSMFSVFNKQLIIEQDAIETIAKKAIGLEMGARSLKNLFHMILTEELYTLYDNPEQKIIITKDNVISRCETF